MNGRSVIVIGGGFDGLPAACYLAAAGADATLLKKNDRTQVHTGSTASHSEPQTDFYVTPMPPPQMRA